MKRNPWLMFALLIVVFGGIFAFMLSSSVLGMFGEKTKRVSSQNSIMHLKLEGIILDGRRVLEPLREYRENKKIKAIVFEINSPGGVVGPSQELNYEILKTRNEFKKPVVVVSSALNASGAYYTSVAADKIIVQPGTLLGSIGVIMEFTNLEKLYDWAKVSRFSINTGKYKDSGAEYRPMRDDEKQLFQDLMNEVHAQFKKAVAEGRNLKPELVEQYADGRVITGDQAVKLGFADEIGGLEDAFKKAAELAELGDDYEIFKAPKEKPSFIDFILSDNEEDTYSKLEKKIDAVLRVDLRNKPLYLMPGY